MLPVDWRAITEGGSTCTNYQIFPGDRIYVGPDCLIKADNYLSKVLAPGLRSGWISAARAIVDQLALMKQQIDPHTNNLAQLAVARLIDNGVFDRHLVQLRQEHRRRRDAMVKTLADPEVSGRIRSTGQEPVGSSTADFQAFFKSEVARFARVIEAAKIPKLD